MNIQQKAHTFLPVFFVFTLLSFAGCSGQAQNEQPFSPVTLPEQTSQTNQQTPPVIPSTQVPTGPIHFSSDKYGFTLTYPSQVITAFEDSYTDSRFLNTPLYGISTFSFSKGKDDSYVRIYPQKDLGRDIPDSKPKTRTVTLDGKKFSVSEWSLRNNQTMIIYNGMDPIKGWNKCVKSLSDCNSIELFARNADDLKTLKEMVASIEFAK